MEASALAEFEYYLSLGSNLGDRRSHLARAIEAVAALASCELRLSHVYQTPAYLPSDAEASWNRPFLNMAVYLRAKQNAVEMLSELKAIEKSLARSQAPRWAPREIDIDLILSPGQRVESPTLKLPHPLASERSFVLDPMKDLCPGLRMADGADSVLNLARRHPQHGPVLMGILNITPDSFSDGGQHYQMEDIDKYLQEHEEHLAILDIGAESTRPGATPLTAQQEWHRLEPVLKHLRERYRGHRLAPRLSVDTYHGLTASRALEFGVAIINDVSGGSDPEMQAVLAQSDCQYVLTHSLSVPAARNQHLPATCDATAEVKAWFQTKVAWLEELGVRRERLILDPGLGFGKTTLQNLALMQGLEELQDLGAPILIGHSRKSFMQDLTAVPSAARDPETLGFSLALARKGVDLLRVHNPALHARSLLAFQHLPQRRLQ